MCIEICADMPVDVCIDVSVDKCIDVYRHLYRHVHRRVCRRVYRHGPPPDRLRQLRHKTTLLRETSVALFQPNSRTVVCCNETTGLHSYGNETTALALFVVSSPNKRTIRCHICPSAKPTFTEPSRQKGQKFSCNTLGNFGHLGKLFSKVKDVGEGRLTLHT